MSSVLSAAPALARFVRMYVVRFLILTLIIMYTHYHVYDGRRKLKKAGGMGLVPARIVEFIPSVVLLASRWFSLVLSPRAHSACRLSCRLLPLSARMIRVLSCSFSDSLSYSFCLGICPSTSHSHNHTLTYTPYHLYLL